MREIYPASVYHGACDDPIVIGRKLPYGELYDDLPLSLVYQNLFDGSIEWDGAIVYFDVVKYSWHVADCIVEIIDIDYIDGGGYDV